MNDKKLQEAIGKCVAQSMQLLQVTAEPRHFGLGSEEALLESKETAAAVRLLSSLSRNPITAGLVNQKDTPPQPTHASRYTLCSLMCCGRS